MEIQRLHSIQEISKQYNTGDLPVLVLCSDTQQYICKYMRPNATYNNANLLYHIENEQLISIDYGGILNNVTFDFPLSQLTETDSILGADIFAHIIKSVSSKQLTEAVKRLKKDYLQCINRSKKQSILFGDMPKEWAVPTSKIENKVEELFYPKWINDTWKNFVECLKSYSNYGK